MGRRKKRTEPLPEGEGWVEWGGELVRAAGCTNGGAPYGLTLEEFRVLSLEEGSRPAWARAKRALVRVFLATQAEDWLKPDEPTDLPDGAEPEVVAIQDRLSPQEGAELHASLQRALDDSEAERRMDVWEYLEQYRAGREARAGC